MPEGPQVHRAGQLISAHAGLPLINVVRPASAPDWALRLPLAIERAEVWGKNIFIHLSSGQIIYNHMLMWGSWRPGCDTGGKKRLHTCFEFGDRKLGYFGGGILKLVGETEAAAIRAKLGPDLIDSKDINHAFADLKKSELPIGEALLDQALVAGVGNIYKSEGLFVARIHPQIPASSLSAGQLERLYEFLKRQMTGDVRRGTIITTTPVAARAGNRRFVYRRRGQPCLICFTKIERIYQGAQLPRSTYFCPRCQPDPTQTT